MCKVCKQIKEKIKAAKLAEKTKKVAEKTGAVVKKYQPTVVSFSKKHKKELMVAGAVAVCAFALMSTPCNTQKIGVIDIARIRAEAEPYQAIVAKQKEYEDIWRMKFQAERAVLDKEDKRLAEIKQKKSMKPAVFQKEIEKLQKKALVLQEKYQGEANKIAAATQSVVSRVDEIAEQATRSVAESKGCSLVFGSGLAIYVSDQADITDDVIRELNKKSVKINYPDPETLTPNQAQ